ncbi:hypothetical protein E2C01_059650 [Portunus trituberculatus]|uniref:Uncharacterized protein n=1 Tax=Portunus trituberculatus TaxID=210409 RepID=A0A5B7H9M4_PORTR|nr:hypothetical protein [Portunus trituberculatus]
MIPVPRSPPDPGAGVEQRERSANGRLGQNEWCLFTHCSIPVGRPMSQS